MIRLFVPSAGEACSLATMSVTHLSAVAAEQS